MSGQPVKTQAEKNKKRNEYMESLALQEQINDMNLQANKTYLLTGQLPPQSQMQDTRTTTEKLKDVELMKQKIVGDFAGTISAQSVHALIQKIIDSPLNLNNSLFRFFAQRATSIAEQYKKIYSVGIEGDANDVARIFEYVKSMYSDTQGKFQTTKSYMNSQTSGGGSRIIEATDMDNLVNQIHEIARLAYQIKSDINLVGLDRLVNILQILKNALPTNEELRIIMNTDFSTIEQHTMDTIEFTDFFKILDKLPKFNEVVSLIYKINQYIKNNDNRTARDGIDRLIALFEPFSTHENILILERFEENIKRPLQNELNRRNELQRQQLEYLQKSQEDQNRRASRAQQVQIISSDNDPVYVRNALNFPLVGNDNIDDEISEIDDNSLFNSVSSGNGLKRGRGRPQGYRKMKGGCLSDGSETHRRHIQEPKEDLRKKANFVGFGINEIHQKQLDKGLVKIRRSTKSNYMDMPTRRVSTNLQGILKTIVGGGVPNYNDLGKLDEEEKIYLNKLISRSELTDRISVPAPSKDQQEKDIHNFEVMRGQIMSGNDSQELVKQFKLLIRKLMKQGLLPKADVEDILTTLIDLGY